MIYLIIIVISFLACIACARYAGVSIGWAVFWGLLFSPASGIAYVYMAVSGDRKPWRVALIGFVLAMVLVFLFLVAVGTFNQSSTPTTNANTTSTNAASVVAPTPISATVPAPNANPSAPSVIPTSGTDVVYIVQCTGPSTSLTDCVDPKRSGEHHYFVNALSSQVVVTSPDDATYKQPLDINTAIAPYLPGQSCHVVDIQNWSCPTVSGRYGFHNGEYIDTSPSYVQAGNLSILSVTRAQYFSISASAAGIN